MLQTHRTATRAIYPKVMPDPYHPGFYGVETPTHHYRGVHERDLSLLLQHLRANENYGDFPIEFRVAYVEVGEDLEGIGHAPRVGEPTEYELWPGEPTEDAIRAHVGDEIDWDGGRAEVVGIEDMDQEGSVEWVMFMVKPLARSGSR